MKVFRNLFIVLFIASCANEKKIEEENKYQIINLIYSNFSNELMTFFAFPKRPNPLPEGVDYRSMLNDKTYMDSLHKITYSKKISKKDSLLKIKTHTGNKKNQQVFAINLKMYKHHNLENTEVGKDKKDFENLYKKFITSDKIDSLDINKISLKNNDSIIKFKKDLLKDKIGVEFRKFNVLVSFSNIIFNKEKSKAIVIGTRSFSGTNSHSLLYFLEKQNRKWKIVYQQVP